MKYSTLYGKESVQKLADDGLEQHHVINLFIVILSY